MTLEPFPLPCKPGAPDGPRDWSDRTAQRLDRARAVLLRQGLRIGWLRALFYDRARRNLAVFLLCLVLQGTLALCVPLWVLLVGAVVLGPPHLLASLRYVPRLALGVAAVERPDVVTMLGALVVAAASFHLALRAGLVPSGFGMANIDLVLLAGVVVGVFAVLRPKADRRTLAAILLVAGLGVAGWWFPATTLGFFVLGHNLVGFLYWIARAPTAADRRAALAATGLFVAAMVAILLGGLDAVIGARSHAILGGALDEYEIGASIFPATLDLDLWRRAVSAYALGQSLHYLVWLKVIPEQETAGQHPIGFAKSWTLLRREVGRLVLGAAVAGLLAMLAVAVFVGMPETRLFYLAGSAFHGYIEIAGLAFVRRGSPKRL